MARFKRLSKEELLVLEKQFVRFLAAQSVLADDWVKIKEGKPKEADTIIDEFSDLVYGSVMRDAKFLERRTRNALFCYQCLSDRFVLIGLEINEAADVDLRRLHGQEIIKVLPELQTRVYTTDKMYTKDKEDEVFQMMELGCEITDGAAWHVLGKLL